MDTPAIQEGIQAGRIADLGEATSPNIEKNDRDRRGTRDSFPIPEQ